MCSKSYIKALKAPLPQVDLVPTGGVDFSTAADFIRAGASTVGVGSGLIDKKIVVAEDWDQLSQKTKEFIQVIAAARQGVDKS